MIRGTEGADSGFRSPISPLAGEMLLLGLMKYLAVIVVAGATYLYLAHKTPVGQAVNAITQSPQAYTPGTDFLKRPLDRTQEVLQQARVRANDQP